MKLKKLLLLGLILGQQFTSLAQYEIILPSDTNQGEGFGYSIDANEDFLVVGNPLHNKDSDSTNQGAVYIFDLTDTSWQPSQKLKPNSSSISDVPSFGITLSLSKNYLTVSDPEFNAVHIFERDESQWNKIQYVQDTLFSSSSFPMVIEISDEYLFVGLSEYTHSNGNTGAVAIYKNEDEEWISDGLILPPDELSVHDFGHIISYDKKNQILIGSRKRETDDGGAFLHKKNEDFWVLDRMHKDGSINEQGLVIHLEENRYAINGNDGTDDYVEIYERIDENWVKINKIYEGISNLNSTNGALPIGDVVHFQDNLTFTNRGLSGGIVYSFQRLNESYDLVDQFPSGFANEIEEDLFQIYLHGFSLASNDKYLFCGTFAYRADINQDKTGAVFVYSLEKSNSTTSHSDLNFSVSPNPCSDVLSLISNSPDRYSIVSIIDNSGRTAMKSINDSSVKVEGLKNGVYWAKIIDNELSRIHLLKFIKI
ncbi:MAG: T9SS type A sorting domain-containing protein [Saprospiraceae bacterium]|nr:T9SS type A sorting domain-containing protein [Saprospiraceae bacterium]